MVATLTLTGDYKMTGACGWSPETSTFRRHWKYSVIKKDGLNFVRLFFLNYTWYVNDLHNIWKRRSQIFKCHR